MSGPLDDESSSVASEDELTEVHPIGTDAARDARPGAEGRNARRWALDVADAKSLARRVSPGRSPLLAANITPEGEPGVVGGTGTEVADEVESEAAEDVVGTYEAVGTDGDPIEASGWVILQ